MFSPTKKLLPEILIIIATVLVIQPLAVCGRPNCDREPDARVLVLGAGLTGLGAARRLSQMGIDDYIILEQSDKIGGRVQSAQFAGTTVQLGPQWVINVDKTVPEENQQPLWPLMQRCNVTVRDAPLGALPSYYYNSKGENITLSPELLSAGQRLFTASSNVEEINRVLSGVREGEDLSAAAGLRESGWSADDPIEELVEYFAIDIALGRPADTASYRDTFDPAVNAVRLFSFGTNINNYIVTDPYTDITDCLADEFLLPNDDRLILESTVHTVAWGDDCVCVTATKRGEDSEYCASYAILTFSVGELANHVITFTPELPIAKRIEFQRLEMANFLKIFIAFNETFWDTGVDFILYSDEINGREYYPLFTPWGDYFPHKPPILEAYLTGDAALRVAFQDLEITKKQIAEVMRKIYGEKASDPVDIIMHDFIVNRFYYGDFSSATPGVGANTFDELNHPIGQLYLAGEAYIAGLHSTAHGALVHGTTIAQQIAEEILGPLTITLVNDSPKVDENSVRAEFSVSRSASLIECGITGRQRVDCSSGGVVFNDLEPGSYNLRIIARNNKEDRTVHTRRFHIGDGTQCAIHLINSGLTVYGNNAKVEFTVSGINVTEILCNVDKQNFSCDHPLVLKDLDDGRHRVRITPQCDQGTSIGYAKTFSISS